MKTKEGLFIKRKGKWLKLPEWLTAWRKLKTTQPPKGDSKVDPKATVSV